MKPPSAPLSNIAAAFIVFFLNLPLALGMDPPPELQRHHYMGLAETKNHYSLLERWQQPIKTPLIILTGVEDLPENWWETATSALEYGFSQVFIFELRGQGHSQRVPGNSKKAIHVEQFRDYASDFLLFLKVIQTRHGIDKQPYIIAHSTGAPVLATAIPMIRESKPGLLPLKVSLWTPLIRLSLSPFIESKPMTAILTFIDRIATGLGFFLMGRRFSDRPFATNKLTNDKKKYEWAEAIRRSNNLNSSGVSLHWGLQTQKATLRLLTNNYAALNVSTLVFVAEDDQVVNNNWSIDNEHWKIKKINNAKHALHLAPDFVLTPILRETFRFFSASSESP